MAGILRRRQIDPDLTPEQREARIAELRRLRKARLRVLAIRSALLSGALAVALVVLAWWLVSSIGGRDFLLAQIVARLPANATLSWRQAEGPAAGPLTMHEVRFRYDAIVFTAQRVTLDPALRPLLGRRLRLDALQIENATLELP
ncbi:MAG TPA: translocation/assembly module TamB, partial [Lysobacter sp.]|nr:translocation/assembly module TamB [Lysobacter sp.]